MSLVITPLAFALAGYLLMWAAFGSVINPIAGVWNMITADYADRESEDLMTNRLDGYTQTVPSSLITFPRYGDKCAELAIESADISAPVYYGDGNKELKKGVGQYLGTMYAGSGSTVLISGHNNTYFHTLGNVSEGDTVTLTTNYGVYTYAVSGTAIHSSGSSESYDLSADYENLVLYTCYPFNALGLTNKRFFVYCRYVSGPKILYDE